MTMHQFSESLPMALYRALDAVMPRFRKIFNEFGLTEPQWRVLRVLWEHDEVAFRELASMTLIPAPSLVGIVDRLTSVGYVGRRRSENDRRLVFVHATDSGRQLEIQVMPRVHQAYAELQSSIDPATWRQVKDGLQKISSIDAPARIEKRAVNS